MVPPSRKCAFPWIDERGAAEGTARTHIDVARRYSRRPTSLFSGTNAVAENVAPCGSRSTVTREYGASTGGTSTAPPSSAVLAAVASALSVENVTPQWAGVSSSLG